MRTFLNDRPFSHIGPNGTHFHCKRGDLSVNVTCEDVPEDALRFAQDVASFVGVHALDYWPHLNGFAGYDTLRFEKK
jgi:hypothetical protein